MTAHRFIGSLRYERSLEAHDALVEQIGKLHSVSRQPARFSRWNNRFSVVVRATEIAPVRENHCVMRMIVDVPVKTFEVVRRTQIVGVLYRNPSPHRVTHSGIAGCRGTPVFLIEVPDARTEAREHRARVVGRSIVDDDQLIVLKTLMQYAVDRLAKQFGAIVSRHDHRDGRRSAHHMISPYTTGPAPRPSLPAR